MADDKEVDADDGWDLKTVQSERSRANTTTSVVSIATTATEKELNTLFGVGGVKMHYTTKQPNETQSSTSKLNGTKKRKSSIRAAPTPPKSSASSRNTSRSNSTNPSPIKPSRRLNGKKQVEDEEETKVESDYLNNFGSKDKVKSTKGRDNDNNYNNAKSTSGKVGEGGRQV